MSDASLMRIPFRPEDEQTIRSMSRWMRFIAVVTIIVGFLALFAVLTTTFFMSFALIPVTVRLGEGAEAIVIERRYLSVAAVAAIVMSAVNIYLGFVLHEAADNFDQMARTDVADQAFLARGLDSLRRYFQVFVAVAVLTFLVGAAVAVAFTTHAQPA